MLEAISIESGTLEATCIVSDSVLNAVAIENMPLEAVEE